MTASVSTTKQFYAYIRLDNDLAVFPLEASTQAEAEADTKIAVYLAQLKNPEVQVALKGVADKATGERFNDSLKAKGAIEFAALPVEATIPGPGKFVEMDSGPVCKIETNPLYPGLALRNPGLPNYLFPLRSVDILTPDGLLERRKGKGLFLRVRVNFSNTSIDGWMRVIDA